MERSVYDAVGGLEGLTALARAWHDRCLADPVASHPFGHPGQHPDHLARLAAYWAEALGGPRLYTHGDAADGPLGDESHVRRLHAGNGHHRELDERAIACFVQAMDDVGIDDDPRLRSTLEAYFRWGTEQYAAYAESPEQVPAGLEVIRWSWSGPESRVEE